MDLRERIRKSNDWTNAPLELQELNNLLQKSFGDFASSPIELANFLLTSNQIQDRTLFLKNILQKLYPVESFWSTDPEETIQQCFNACKLLGIPATFDELQGRASMEDNLEFLKNLLSLSINNPNNEHLDSLHSLVTTDEEDFDQTASWETRPFNELPDVYGDHVTFNADGEINNAVPLAAANQPRQSDANAFINFDQEVPNTTLTAEKRQMIEEYLKPKKSVGSTQAGHSSSDWLTRLEKLLIHFFLIIFDCSTDASKLLMEVMPPEATGQIEEIFQLLLKAEPEMYESLGHIVELAEHWLVHWKGDNSKKLKAMMFVKQYVYIMKTPNYYNLPVEQRLQKLGAFIVGLKDLDPASKNYRIHHTASEYMQRALEARVHIQEVMKLSRRRPPSPRVLPSVHFSRVVANILCQRPCRDPLQHPPVYADNFDKTSFGTPTIDFRQITKFVSSKYGYQERRGNSAPSSFRYKVGRFRNVKSPVLNKKCWLPIYNSDYMSRINDKEYCANLTPAELEKQRIKAQFDLLRPTTGKAKRQVTKRILSARGNRRNQRKGGRPDSADEIGGRGNKSKRNKKVQVSNRSKKGEEGKKSMKFRHSDHHSHDHHEISEHSHFHDRKKSVKKSWKSQHRDDEDSYEDRKKSKKSRKTKGGDATRRRADEKKSKQKFKKVNKTSETYDWDDDDDYNSNNNSRKQTKKKTRSMGSQADDWNDDGENHKGKKSKKVNKSRHPSNDSDVVDDDYEKGRKSKKGNKSRHPSDDHDAVDDDYGKGRKSKKGNKSRHPSDDHDAVDDDYGKGRKSKKGNKSRHPSNEAEDDDEGIKTIYKSSKDKGKKRKSSAGGDYSPDESSFDKSRKSRKSRNSEKKSLVQNRQGQDRGSQMESGDLFALQIEGSGVKQVSKLKAKSRANSMLIDDKELGETRSESDRRRRTTKAGKRGSKHKSQMLQAGEYKRTKSLKAALGVSASGTDIRVKPNNVGDLSEHIMQLRKAKEAEEKEKLRQLRITKSLGDLPEGKKRKKSKKDRQPEEDSMDPAVWEKRLVGTTTTPNKMKRHLRHLNGYDANEYPGEDAEIYSKFLSEHKGNEFFADARSVDQGKLKCAQSLWGALPLPTPDLLPNGKAVICTDGDFPFPIRSKNILKEDTTGGLESYSQIPEQVEKYKQIFRDDARARGFPRPSTADVTRKMILRTTQVMNKRTTGQDTDMVLAKLETLKGPNYLKRRGLLPFQSEGSGLHSRLKKKIQRESVQLSPLTTTGPTLAMSVYEHLKKTKFDNEESEYPGEDGLLRGKAKKEWGPFGHLHPGVYDETARLFHGVTSGPFIPHVNTQDKTRIAFSLAETPIRKTREPESVKSKKSKLSTKKSRKGRLGGGDGQDDDDKTDSKLPSLAVRQKVSSTTKIRGLKETNASAFIKTLVNNQDPLNEEEYEDKLLYPVSNPAGKKRGKSKFPKNTIPVASKLPYLHKVAFMEEDEEGSSSYVCDGRGDQCDQCDQVVQEPQEVKDPCWEIISNMFKSPLKAPAIPLPDNLVIHIEKKYPTMEWPRGIPVAMRYYPSGQPFCIIFQNGAGRVHYPHGGIAALISAPQPRYCRILVIRDPFDKFYFFDKAVIADLNCTGKGIVFDEKNLVRLQYNLEGGFSQDGLDKPVQRWRWNEGGHRMVLKLNRYMALRILDIDKMFLSFFGNKRGFRINLGAGQEINLMSGSCDSSKDFPPRYPDKKPSCSGFDFIRGRYNTPIVGYVDKSRGSSRRGCRQDSLCSELSIRQGN